MTHILGFQDEVILRNLFHFIFFQVVGWSLKFLVRKTLGRSRKDPHHPHEGNSRCPEEGVTFTSDVRRGRGSKRGEVTSSYNFRPTGLNLEFSNERERANGICHPCSLPIINSRTLTLSVCLSVSLSPSLFPTLLSSTY